MGTLLAAQPWRTGEEGNVSAQPEPLSQFNTWNQKWTQDKVPLYVTLIPTRVYATRAKESAAFLKFGRDSNWPLSVTLALALDPETSLSITYEVDWEEYDGSTPWAWTKFAAAAEADGIRTPPAFTRPETKWDNLVAKDGNSIRIILRERLADVTLPVIPEDPGLPIMILYAPRTTLRLRKRTPRTDTMLSTFGAAVASLYEGRHQCVERLETHELAIIGALGNENERDLFPGYLRKSRPLICLEQRLPGIREFMMHPYLRKTMTRVSIALFVTLIPKLKQWSRLV
jgi:hypothetical protein